MDGKALLMTIDLGRKIIVNIWDYPLHEVYKTITTNHMDLNLEVTNTWDVSISMMITPIRRCCIQTIGERND